MDDFYRPIDPRTQADPSGLDWIADRFRKVWVFVVEADRFVRWTSSVSHAFDAPEMQLLGESATPLKAKLEQVLKEADPVVKYVTERAGAGQRLLAGEACPEAAKPGTAPATAEFEYQVRSLRGGLSLEFRGGHSLAARALDEFTKSLDEFAELAEPLVAAAAIVARLSDDLDWKLRTMRGASAAGDSFVRGRTPSAEGWFAFLMEINRDEHDLIQRHKHLGTGLPEDVPISDPRELQFLFDLHAMYAGM